MFKFVFTKEGMLYILSTQKYHQDTGVPSSLVKGAGYLDIDYEGDFVQVEMSGKSIGYDMAFSLGTQIKVNEKLLERKITHEDFEKQYNSRGGIALFDLGDA